MDTKITPEELMSKLQGDFRELAEDMCRAINDAEMGRVIADSEEPVRDANAVFRESAYQKAIDLLHDKLVQGGFSPSADPAGPEVEA